MSNSTYILDYSSKLEIVCKMTKKNSIGGDVEMDSVYCA
jgi:hypothetical protein